jgi:D-alanyl-D-alanine-carboxypeptidase/D-alanyl-D-alanine-endopeptidase
MRRLALAISLVACGSKHRATPHVQPVVDIDPDGPHRAAITSLAKPMIDAEIVSGLVIGIYDAGKLEIYGFGKGPGGKPPTSRTLFEIGSITKVYTSLMLADAIQRHEVALDTPVAELLPPGVTVPTQGKKVITLRQLALHTSGLPRLPPSLLQRGGAPEPADPYAKYGEDMLYADLVRTQLDHAPDELVSYSNYGVGLLGHALGRKLGGSYSAALAARVLKPLGLADTYIAVPAAAAARRATGTNDELAPVPPWTFDALAGAGALVSTARDQLKFVEAQIDAALGSKAPLRPAMKLTQEPQLSKTGDNEGLGWQIDSHGRCWHNGGTGGFHAYVGFDPKTKRGVVVLASTSLSLLDHVAEQVYAILDGEPVVSPALPGVDVLAQLVGTYNFGGEKLAIALDRKRLFVTGQGEKPHRLVPVNDHTFWIEALQGGAVFERDAAGKVARVVFLVGGQRIAATRVE